eukprot:scaffold79285_cov30-Phaeocystis_antarctica.AAC.2
MPQRTRGSARSLRAQSQRPCRVAVPEESSAASDPQRRTLCERGAGNPSLTVTSQRALIGRVAPQLVWGRAAP